MGLQDPGDVAGPGAAVSEFHDLLPRGVGQRPPVDEHPAELVHAAVTVLHGGLIEQYPTGVAYSSLKAGWTVLSYNLGTRTSACH